MKSAAVCQPKETGEFSDGSERSEVVINVSLDLSGRCLHLFTSVCTLCICSDLLAPSLLQYRKRYVSIIFKEETTYIVVKFEM